MRIVLTMRWLMVIVAVAFTKHLADGSVCNKAVCASVVSKCMLTQSCKCDMTHCSCCKDCVTCLSYLYDECCSCVDMCPGQSVLLSDGALTSSGRKSYLEELQYSVPDLFRDLTNSADMKGRWRSVTIPITHIVTDISLQSVEDDTLKKNSLTGNCTVAYMLNCMTWKKCKSSCESMGSSSFRWFRDGCCECISESCKHYGSDESRCLNCSEGEVLVEKVNYDELDFSEDMDPKDADLVN